MDGSRVSCYGIEGQVEGLRTTNKSTIERQDFIGGEGAVVESNIVELAIERPQVVVAEDAYHQVSVIGAAEGGGLFVDGVGH